MPVVSAFAGPALRGPIRSQLGSGGRNTSSDHDGAGVVLGQERRMSEIARCVNGVVEILAPVAGGLDDVNPVPDRVKIAL
jgi:hypothetical protein